MKKLDFSFFKKPEFWVTTIIAIILAFAGGKYYVYYYGDYSDIQNNSNCAINSNSPQSIATLNQQGDNFILNQNLEFPNASVNSTLLYRDIPLNENETRFLTRVMKINLSSDFKGYKYIYQIQINSVGQIKNLLIGINSPTLLYTQARSGGFGWSGKSVSSNQQIIIISPAFGSYYLIVYTEKKELPIVQARIE